MKFFDLPAPERSLIRGAICALGGDVAAYTARGGLQVSLPNDKESADAITLILSGAGWAMAGDYYFPLGSDKPPRNQRHYGNYPRTGSPGFWNYAEYRHWSDM